MAPLVSKFESAGRDGDGTTQHPLSPILCSFFLVPLLFFFLPPLFFSCFSLPISSPQCPVLISSFFFSFYLLFLSLILNSWIVPSPPTFLALVLVQTKCSLTGVFHVGVGSPILSLQWLPLCHGYRFPRFKSASRDGEGTTLHPLSLISSSIFLLPLLFCPYWKSFPCRGGPSYLFPPIAALLSLPFCDSRGVVGIMFLD